MVPRFPRAAAFAAVSLSCCVAAPKPIEPAALLPILAALPAAAAQIHLADALREAPELVAALDVAPADGVVTLDELTAGFTDPARVPALAVVTLLVIERTVRGR